VCINCAAIPDNLLESEFFGHEKGAFTGASNRYEGKLRLANGGTVFFDEISEMSPSAQAKLLRVVENKPLFPVGSNRGMQLDIRILAATNANPQELIPRGKFREDLYYRLNVCQVHLPPLRERKEDIPLMLGHFLKENNVHFGQTVGGFSEDVLMPLLEYDWPGNIRELKNMVEATFVHPLYDRIRLCDLPQAFRERLRKMERLPKNERDRLLAALLTTNWNKSKAAMKLNWSRMTLYRKMAKYHLQKGWETSSAAAP
jgi:transcriptional regulator with PAS, ATPase and Fis domain